MGSYGEAQVDDEGDVERNMRFHRHEMLGDSGQKPGGILDLLVLQVRHQPKQ